MQQKEKCVELLQIINWTETIKRFINARDSIRCTIVSTLRIILKHWMAGFRYCTLAKRQCVASKKVIIRQVS